MSMDVFSAMRARVCQALDTLASAGDLPKALDLASVTVEPPRDPAHGDMATNAAMVLASSAGTNPRALAQKLCGALADDPRILQAEPGGPGFVNIRLAPSLWHSAIRDVLERGADYGRTDIGKGRKANIEFVSANPTGPLHVGNVRGAVYGDALASLLAFVGYEVTREYYVNDAGAQLETLARSVHLRYRQAHGETAAIGEGLYPGDYLIPVGDAAKAHFGDKFMEAPESEWLEPLARFATEKMMARIRADLAAIGVRMDRYVSERALAQSGCIEAAIARLKARGLIYTGTLEPPKSRPSQKWTPRPQLLFRATEYGDDTDRPLKKSDGAWTYFSPDIAYHFDKLSRGYALIVDILGADHAGYVKRMKAAVAALSGGTVPFDIKLVQLVRLLRKGVPVKMSKRTGAFVPLQEVVKEVGADAVRFLMLMRKNDAPLDFDLAEAVTQSRDNPIFYVQYAHARVCSAFRQAREAGIAATADALRGADLSRLTQRGEIALARKIAQWPRTVEAAARADEPHRIAFYLQELATEFHALWTQGRAEAHRRFVRADAPEDSLARLALLRASAIVIGSGLAILGIDAVEEMR